MSEVIDLGDSPPPAPVQQPASPAAEASRAWLLDSYAKIVARRPLTVCLVMLGIVLFICVLPFGIFMGDEMVTVDFALDSMQVRGDDISDRFLSFEAADCGGICEDWRRLTVAELGQGSAAQKRKLDDHDWHRERRDVTVVFGSKDGENVVTESRLKQVLGLERDVAKWLGEPIHTPFRQMLSSYPSGPVPTGAALRTAVAATAEYVHDTRNQDSEWPLFEANFSACTPISPFMTAQFRGAWEWDAYHALVALETDEIYVTFFEDTESWGGGHRFYGHQRDVQISKDSLLIIGVIMTCGVLIAIQTRSLFIAAIGWFAIILAVGVAFSLYRILVSGWFGILNGFSIFLLLGIACDDIFVAADSWRHAVEVIGIDPDDCEARLRFMVPRTFSAITTTSLTTAGAFFGNAISNIPPLKLFGIFSGFMVMADLIITVALMPSVFVLQQKWFGGFTCGLKSWGASANSPRIAERLLTRTVAPRVFRIAPLLVLFFTTITAVCLNLALELPMGAEFHVSGLFPYDHPQQRSYRAMKAMKDLEPEYVYNSIVFGVVPTDNGAASNPSSETEAVWDKDFDVWATGSQEFTEALCNDLLAERGLVRRLDQCWAQAARRQFISNGETYPTQDPAKDRQRLIDIMGHDHDLVRWGPEGNRWVVINFQTTALSSSSVSELRAMYNKFEKFMEKWNAEAKRRGLDGHSRAFQASAKWRFMSTIENMASTCIAASIISTVIVLVLLLATMQNLVVVAIIVTHVIAVCLTLVACFYLEGRSLGVLESIAATLLVGLSVDYLVHFGSSYLEGPSEATRELRVLNAFAHVGCTVMAGSVTTVISALFLCAGTITFFNAFGTFVIGMILLALVFTFFSMSATLYLFGPENDFSSLNRCRRACKVADMQPASAPEADGERNVLTGDLELAQWSRRTRILTMSAACVIFVIGVGVRIGLSSRSTEEVANCPDLTELEFTMEGYAIAQTRDSYRCLDYDKIPNGCTYYVSEFEPIVSPGLMGVVHHMILFSIPTPKTDCPYTCFEMPNAVSMDAAWAVGVGKVKYPDGLAYPIGGNKQALQMHYFNPALDDSLVDDRSGIKLKLSKTPPTIGRIANINIGLHPLGKLTIPPGVANKSFYAECEPQLRGPVTVVAFAVHAHKLGIGIVTELRRRPKSPGGGGGLLDYTAVGDVGSDPKYHFDYQRIEMFSNGDERYVEPGDVVRVICSFNSTSRTRETYTGWGSTDEMCMTFLYAYPAENIESNNCMSEYSYDLP